MDIGKVVPEVLEKFKAVYRADPQISKKMEFVLYRVSGTHAHECFFSWYSEGGGVQFLREAFEVYLDRAGSEGHFIDLDQEEGMEATEKLEEVRKYVKESNRFHFHL